MFGGRSYSVAAHLAIKTADKGLGIGARVLGVKV
jgi:hypothetical protein